MSRLPVSPYIPRPIEIPTQPTRDEATAMIAQIIERLTRWMDANDEAQTVTIHMAGGVIQQIEAPSGIDVIVIGQDEEQE